MATSTKKGEGAASAASSLHEKLVEVAREIRTVNRGKTNESQGYKFAAAFDVQQQVLPALLERGILFYPERRQVFDAREYKTKSGISQFLVLHTTVWVGTDGKDRIEVSVVGSGTDMGDKGAYKGMTGDMKYAISQLLGIAFVDMDAENDREDEVRVGTAEIEELKALGTGANLSKDELAAFVEKETGKKKPGLLTIDEFAALKSLLQVMAATGTKAVE